jgi:iron-sulfur cluster assembly protein
MSPFPITATEEAIAQIKRILAKDSRAGIFLRIGLKGGGCSGLEYVMKFDDKARDTDLVSNWNGVVVRCDPKSARFLEGTRLEYTGNLIGGGFAFDNPNASRKCGCGTSFTPKAGI